MLNFLYNLATDKYRGILPDLVKFFLFLLSQIYALIIRFLIFKNRLLQQRLNCKVISIGNITLGGTGKTLLAEYIAKLLKQKGHRVAVLTRGYGRKVTTSQRHNVTSYENMGDEPYMLKMKLGDVPVLVDADRIRSGKKAISEYGVDSVILDDGFQQWRIKKDLEIVTIDATDPFGNGNMVPRGLLREPLSGLRRADIFILTKTNLNFHVQEAVSYLNQINPKALILKSVHQPIGLYRLNKQDQPVRPESIKEKKAVIICGIADPDSFSNLITGLGINIVSVYTFADHHRYSYRDLERLDRQLQSSAINTMITTEKDFVKISPYLSYRNDWRFELLVLRIEIKLIDNEQDFINRLLGLYSA
ncbi:MAG: tetraacyldisaccharide 4'-kinase [Candidatus Omnitrophota bacterium]|nr:MAG: tetraacyldisaccharide 4'-kinase [Candidatus Omnitrophota bacterium]